MDRATREFLLGELDSLIADNLTEVSHEVQLAVDAQFGEYNAAIAQDLMAFFMNIANEENMENAEDTDFDRTSSEGGEGGDYWLVQLARALAEVQSAGLEKLMDSYGDKQTSPQCDSGADAGKIEKKVHTDSQIAFIQAQGKGTAYGRLLGMSSEVTSNLFNSVGSGLTAVSRKN